MDKFSENALITGYLIGGALVVVGAWMIGWRYGVIALGSVVLWGCKP